MAIGTCVLSYAERLPRSADHGDLASHLCLQQALLQQNRAEILPPPECRTVIVGKGRIGPGVNEERFQNWRKRRIVQRGEAPHHAGKIRADIGPAGPAGWRSGFVIDPDDRDRESCWSPAQGFIKTALCVTNPPLRATPAGKRC